MFFSPELNRSFYKRKMILHLCCMGKDKEKATAKQLFMQGEQQKKIAELVGVTEKTVNTWCANDGWKQQRDVKLNGQQSRAQNLKELIGVITEKRIELQKDIDSAKQKGEISKQEDLRKEANQLANEVGMYSKALEQMDQENRIPLATYIQVMEEIFQDLNKYSPKVFASTIDFQEKHLNKISLKY